MAGPWRLVGLRDKRNQNYISSVREADTGWWAVDAEAARSRRSGRAFVLMAVSGDAAVAQALRPLLRVPDRAWVDGGVVYVLLSDCDARQVAGFVARAQVRLPAAFATNNVSVAVFPDEAVTVAGLVDKLRSKAPSQRLSSRRSVVMPSDARGDLIGDDQAGRSTAALRLGSRGPSISG